MSAALNFADALSAEVVRTVALDVLHSDAAAELRRLHAVNAALLEALEALLAEADDGIATCPLTRNAARSAIAAARGQA